MEMENRNNTTEMVFILDKSGSMAGMEKDTVGGFNAMIGKQKEIEGKAYVSTILFSNNSEVLHDRLDLREVGPLTEKEYTVGGCTALMDAIGGAIRHIENIHKYARPEDVPAHTVFFITTDGMENASREYSSDRVKEMIRRQEKEHGWEFLFIAANIDAVETAGRIGIRKERSANYSQSREGTAALYGCMASVMKSVRTGHAIEESWSEALEPEKKKSRR